MSHLHTEPWLEDAWEDLETTIDKIGFRSPLPGFRERFALRLADRRRQEERRNGLVVAGFWLLLATGLLIVLIWVLSPLLPSPAVILLSLIRLASSVSRGLLTLLSVAGSLFRYLPDFLPSSLVYGFLATLAAMGAWGFSALRSFAFDRGVRL